MDHDVFVFPDYRRDNPYQDLLYGAIDGPFQFRYAGVGAALAHLRNVGFGRSALFHLHWEDSVYRAETSERQARAACRAFLEDLAAFRDEGGRVIWTVHNEASHEIQRHALHVEFTAEIARLVDRVHFHSARSAAKFVADRGVDPATVLIAAHGNYAGRYAPYPLDQATARAELNLPDGFIVLLFGRLSAYKGAVRLFDAMGRLDDASISAVVAGRQIDPLDKALSRLSPAVRARIHVMNEFVSPAETPRLFAAADVVAMPYRRSMTSGTMMLALTLGRPVIAPNDDHPLDVLQDGVEGFIYRRDDPQGLESAIARARAAPDQAALREAAVVTARRYDWRYSTKTLSGALHELAALPRPQRRLS